MSVCGKNLNCRSSQVLSLFLGVVLLVTILVLPSLSPAVMPSESSNGVFLPSNRLDTRGIQRAQKFISKGQFSQAIRFLDEILEREEDSFVVDPTGESYGLKETARQMIKNLPPAGRRIYETTFGPVARRLLKESLASGDFQKLRQITQRYFYTPAGHEAALLFAQQEADQGRHLTAALTYQQLLETEEAAARFQPQLSILAATSWLAAGNPTQAKEALQQLGQQGVHNIQLAGEDHSLRASSTDRVDWLLQTVGAPVMKDLGAEHQWLTARGNPARNGQAEGGLPHLRVRWQVRLLEHHNLETVHEEMARLLARQEKSRLPAATPLAVGDYIITRSAHGLIAIDFKTGKRIWQAQPQQVALLQKLMEVSDPQNNDENENSNNLEPAQSFARRIWEDYLYNTTSSDGKRVYVIRDLAQPKRGRTFQGRREVVPENDNTNRLCAYDLPTQGKLVWEIDGAARSDELRGAFFLGAPVTVGQSLYCLAEIKSETAIYLVVLDRQTGALQWRQQLADLETGIGHDVKRRLQASMPSYADGMLICPTRAGVVIGVDLAKQALAWAYHYEPEGLLSSRQKMLQGYVFNTKQRWVHSAPVIVDGRVLLTPPESDQVHCLDILSGKLLWKEPRGDAMFLAGVEDDRILLVGNHQLSALQLADGKPAWMSKKLKLPEDATPTGCGFFSQGQYYLPLSNAQVIAVDVATGKLAGQASSREGQLLGNLICYQGAVISQTGRFLDCFEQVDVLREKSERRLVAAPTDFEALRTLGEIAYNEGQLARAVDLLRKAYESEPEDIRTREVLGEALVAALDEDFADYQQHLPLLAEIQQGSAEQRFTLFRLQSQGLLELGRTAEAFDVCLKAYEDLGVSVTELTIGNDHQLSADRWLGAQVASIWTSASEEQQEQMAERFLPLLTETMQVADPILWQHFYDCFGSLESAEALGIALATENLEQGELLAAQQLFLKLTESKNPGVRRAAIANTSRILHEAERPFLAATYDQQLQGALADEECLPGMTGAECLAKWAPTSQGGLPDWPYGQVKLSVEKSDRQVQARNRSPLTGVYAEPRDAILSPCNMLVGMNAGRNRTVTVRDSLGRDFFHAKIDQGSPRMLNAPGSIYAVTRGNLLLLSLGRQIVAFDTLSPNGDVLWRKETASNFSRLSHYELNQRHRKQHVKLGRNRSTRSPSIDQSLGVIGPVTSDSCVFQIDLQLVCVDTRTGETKWSRDNLPLGCDLFGDEEIVFVIPKEAKQASMFSTVDGHRLGETTHDLPAWEERLATVGRQIIRWHRRDDRQWELSSIDPLSGEELWKHEFERNSILDIAQNRFVAVAAPSGHCVIVDIHEGRVVVDQPIKGNVSATELHLLVGEKNFVLSVQQPPKIDRKRAAMPFNGNGMDFTRKAFAGQVYLFDRETGLAAWEHPAEVRGLPLMLSQAADLPILTFAGNIRGQGRSRTKPNMGLMLLEKSSGRMLYHDETLPQSPHHFFVHASDTEPSETVVEMSTRTVKLQFTDRPRAPEPPTRQDIQRNPGAGTGALQKIGAKFFGGG